MRSPPVLPTMRWLLALGGIVAASPASAHGGAADIVFGGAAWSYDPWFIVPLYLVGILFLIGTRSVWRQAGFGRGVRVAQVACFWTGWLALALAVVSPLHWLGEQLFVAHMLEHMCLMLVAAPLIAMSRPLGALLWGLPVWLRRWLGAAPKNAVVSRGWRMLTNPLVATALQTLALWAWHIPALYESALRDDTVHRLQHVTFFASALLFWWVLFYGRAYREQDRTRYGLNLICLFITMLQCSMLGFLLTMAPRPLYPAQTAFAADFGLSPLQDQQLAGLVMWVPTGLVYSIIAVVVASRWLNETEPRSYQRPAPTRIDGLPISTG